MELWRYINLSIIIIIILFTTTTDIKVNILLPDSDEQWSLRQGQSVASQLTADTLVIKPVAGCLHYFPPDPRVHQQQHTVPLCGPEYQITLLSTEEQK